jgi:rod shape-determining protein MreD
MMIPFTTPHWLLIVIGFFTGLTVDAFRDSMGFHAAACTFMMFMRPAVLRMLTPKGSYENMDQPRVHILGYGWFLAYAGVLILLHHTVYFSVEVFSFDNFIRTVGKVLLSSAVSTVLIFLTAVIFSPSKNRI